MNFLKSWLALFALISAVQALALPLRTDPDLPTEGDRSTSIKRPRSLRAAHGSGSAGHSIADGRSTSKNRTAPSWIHQRFSYETAGRSLPEVLRDFGAALAIPTVVSDAVEGRVRGRFESSAGEFLNGLMGSFGIIWYFDGQALYVYAAREFQTRVYRLKDYDHRRIEALQSRLGWGDSRYSLRFSAKDQTLLVSGPPRHLELIGQLIDALDSSVQDRQRNVVEVVPLRFASAADRTLQDTRIPGVASLMQALFSGARTQQVTDLPTPPSDFRYQQLLKSMEPGAGTTKSPSILDLLSGRRTAPPRGDGQENSTMPSSPTYQRIAAPRSDVDSPHFVADPNNNAILISGHPARMAHYVEAIKRLDVEPVLLELEALIMDVSSEQTEQLGLTWSVASRAGIMSWDIGGEPAGSTAQTVQALWTQAGARIQMQLQAMVKDGRARLVARPKVVAVANQLALLSEMRKVSVKVAGNLAANLFTVETGTAIHVLPQVQLVQGGYRIRLNLHVEDGDLEDQKVDGIPIVKRLQIDTEARLTEGESVLLGGITADRQSQQRVGVPGLSELPLIGGLFRSTATQSKRYERLLMITPRIIRPMRATEANLTPGEQPWESRIP